MEDIRTKQYKSLKDAVSAFGGVHSNDDVRKLINLSNDIETNNVRIEIFDETIYCADNSFVRLLQLMVKLGKLDPKDVHVYDEDENGNEYEMIFQEDGCFYNEFTSSFYNISTDISFQILT